MPRRVNSFEQAARVYGRDETEFMYRLAALDEERELMESLVSDEFTRTWQYGGGAAIAAGGVPAGCGEDPAAIAGGGTPCVIRGAKSQELGVDWLRLSGPAKHRGMIAEVLRVYFGDGESCSGLWGYKAGMKFGEYGARLVFNPDGTKDLQRGHLGVELPGGALAVLDGERRVELLRDLMELGDMSCTRVDLAWDVHGEYVALAEGAWDACEAGELVGARTWDRVQGRGASRGLTVYLGKRGSRGSGRCVRVYDKGLEQGWRVPNKWQRWEVEFTGDCARQVGEVLRRAVCWAAAGRAMTVGAVDFRQVTGSRELARRPRSAWWSGVLSLARSRNPERIKAKRRLVSYRDWRAWATRAVLPTVKAQAAAAGWTVERVVEDLLRDTRRLNQRDLKRPVVREFVERHLFEGAAA